MAKSSFSGFKWNRGGYQEAMDNGKCQSILKRYADSAAGGANAEVNAHGHDGSHFDVKEVQGKFAHGYIVHPTTNEGYAHAVKALGQFGG